MITESDLRTAFADEAHDVSEPADVMARLAFDGPSPRASTRHHRLVWAAPVAAAAAAVIALSAAVAITDSRHVTTTAASGGHTLPWMPGRELRFTASVSAVSGYEIEQSYLSPDRETTDLVVPGGSGVISGEVVIYAAGAFDPAEVSGGDPVSVQGHSGYYGLATSSAHQLDHLDNPSEVPTLAWEFAPERWALVQGWDAADTPPLQELHLDPRTEMTRVAAAVNTSAAAPLLVPYRVGHLPAGLRHGGGGDTAAMAPSDWQSYLWFLGAGSIDPALTIEVHPKTSRDTMTPTSTVNGHPATYRDGTPSNLPAFFATRTGGAPSSPTVTTGGAPSSPTARSTGPTPGIVYRSGHDPLLTVDFGTAVVTITGDYPRDELESIAASMTLASQVDDRSTWFDATA